MAAIDTGFDWRRADAQGRIKLPAIFKNKPVILQQTDSTTIVLKLAAVVPAQEEWLHRDAAAMASVQRGLEQASTHAFADNPAPIEDPGDLD